MNIDHFFDNTFGEFLYTMYIFTSQIVISPKKIGKISSILGNISFPTERRNF